MIKDQMFNETQPDYFGLSCKVCNGFHQNFTACEMV
jgi:hypothetical protein